MTAAPTEPRSPSSHEVDVADLASHGYHQRLNRSLGGFSSFAVQGGKPTSIAEEHRVPAAPGS